MELIAKLTGAGSCRKLEKMSGTATVTVLFVTDSGWSHSLLKQLEKDQILSGISFVQEKDKPPGLNDESVIIVCPHSGRSKGVVDEGLRKVGVKQKEIIVLMVHHTTKKTFGKVDSQESMNSGFQTDYKGIHFIDIGLDDNHQLYQCNKNTDSLRKLASLIHDRTGEQKQTGKQKQDECLPKMTSSKEEPSSWRSRLSVIGAGESADKIKKDIQHNIMDVPDQVKGATILLLGQRGHEQTLFTDFIKTTFNCRTDDSMKELWIFKEDVFKDIHLVVADRMSDDTIDNIAKQVQKILPSRNFQSLGSEDNHGSGSTDSYPQKEWYQIPSVIFIANAENIQDQLDVGRQAQVTECNDLGIARVLIITNMDDKKDEGDTEQCRSKEHIAKCFEMPEDQIHVIRRSWMEGGKHKDKRETMLLCALRQALWYSLDYYKYR